MGFGFNTMYAIMNGNVDYWQNTTSSAQNFTQIPFKSYAYMNRYSFMPFSLFMNYPFGRQSIYSNSQNRYNLPPFYPLMSYQPSYPTISWSNPFSSNSNSSLVSRFGTSVMPDYAQDFERKTSSRGRMFTYTGSSQSIKRQAGSFFHKKGTYTPKVGDTAIWTNVDDPNHGHIGIVTKVEGDTVWITEGNSGNRVKTNKYPMSKLMNEARFNGFIDMHSMVGSDVALKAAKVAQQEEAKGVCESNMKGGGSNDSVDIRRYKRGAVNNAQWCAYFTSYCYQDGQSLVA